MDKFPGFICLELMTMNSLFHLFSSYKYFFSLLEYIYGMML